MDVRLADLAEPLVFVSKTGSGQVSAVDTKTLFEVDETPRSSGRETDRHAVSGRQVGRGSRHDDIVRPAPERHQRPGDPVLW